MKLNIAYPATGGQKIIEILEEAKLANLYGKRIAQEFPGEVLGEQFAGYVFKITGGSDKEGFPMRQGVLVSGRVRLLLPLGAGMKRGRKGECARKSVRGCVVGHDVACLSVVVVKKGAAEIEGVTDRIVPRRLGPKRASKIRKLFNLDKKDDVRKYVVRRAVQRKKEGSKVYHKAPKIQRLITPERLQRKRRALAQVKKRAATAKTEAEAFKVILAKQKEAAKAARASLAEKKQSRLKAARAAKVVPVTA